MARSKDFDEQEVLAKAVEIFWRKGYKATSMQDLVDGLGISRSSLYDTYTDKHTLYVKALDMYQKDASKNVCSIVNNSGSAKAAIRRLLEYTTTDTEQKGCFLVNSEVEVAPHDKQIGTMICSSDQEIEDAFYTAIKRGQESGEISNKQDARALARFTYNTVKGIRVSAKSSTNKALFKDIIDMAIEALN
ncbi:TetR/AcrR family transcriptional regulator [Mucilaginibacter ginkgonis]|uniref:TetR/AcrR family transcriptional regulator n=1 Tax=Mucilaginibacter ginkgonis TaxID=2682091 RepID=A0A6I4INV2_9SPHI|nr:TetR/AcrR family transcriptional regulator [Mucilaginibacter ginkgonis]QQL48884.1 TetR/AcrR family transcriptional regulator [Mucilaginibacter ginkgonis]